MAKKVKTFIKLNLAAGEATPAPPVGPALGQHGVPIMDFIKEYNARTANRKDKLFLLSSLSTKIEVLPLLPSFPLSPHLLKRNLVWPQHLAGQTRRK